MIIPALLTGDINASVGQAFGYGLLWALIGSLTGTLLAAPPTAPADQVSPRARAAGSAVLAALKPLGLVLLVTTAIGTAVWIVEVATDGSTRGTRSLPIALVDTDAVRRRPRRPHARARLARRLRAPRARAGGAEPAAAGRGARRRASPTRATYRLFDYRDGVSAIVFLLMLVLLVGLPVCGALLAGFTVARERAASTPVLAAAWGALVGPVWAIALALLNALLQDTLFGHAQGESVFGIVLVLGALVGALGGYLAAGAIRSDASRRGRRRTGYVRPQAPDAEPDEAAEREAEHDRHPELAAAAVVARRCRGPPVSSSGSAVSADSAVAVGRRRRDDLAGHLEVDRGVELLGLEVVARVAGGERDVVGARLGVEMRRWSRRRPRRRAGPRRAARRSVLLAVGLGLLAVEDVLRAQRVVDLRAS